MTKNLTLSFLCNFDRVEKGTDEAQASRKRLLFLLGRTKVNGKTEHVVFGNAFVICLATQNPLQPPPCGQRQ